MNAIDQTNYISTVADIYSKCPHAPKAKEKISQWIQSSLIDKSENTQEVEDCANRIFQEFPALRSRKRFHFSSETQRETLLKIVFQQSFLHGSDQLIVAAERIEPKKESFYPNWKKVCWIKIPKATAIILNDTVFKIAISIAAAVIYCFGAYVVYQATTHFVAAKMIPFFINNTPIQVIRLGNYIFDAKDLILANLFLTILGIGAVRFMILRMPEIPYVTRVARMIDLWSVLVFLARGPSTISHFFVDTAIDVLSFGWHRCEDMSNFFNRIAQNTDDERLNISKKKAYEIWKNVTVIEQRPPSLEAIPA